MKRSLFILFLSFAWQNLIHAQSCFDSIKDNQVLILHNNNNNKQELVFFIDNQKSFNSVRRKKLIFNVDYLNTFSEKSSCSWNNKKFVKNKRSIIATATICGIFLIPSFAYIKINQGKGDVVGPGPGSFFSELIVIPTAASFAISAIGLGIKRAMIIKKSKKNQINCTF